MGNHFDSQKMIDAITRFSSLKVLVIGDVMLDEFIWGTVDRISPEAPVPVVKVTSETTHLGGAANVVNNIVSVGGLAILAGVIGDDQAGLEIIRELEELKCQTDGIVTDGARPTTVKTRVFARAQQVVRVDREKKAVLPEDITDKLAQYVNNAAGSLDAIIVSDYGKGVVNSRLISKLGKVFKTKGLIITADPQINQFSFYSGFTAITPNHHEAAAGAGFDIDSEETLIEAGNLLRTRLNLPLTLITHGDEGMMLFHGDSEHQPIPAVAREVFDVSGAGDTVIAFFTLGLAAGLTAHEASILASFAAGIVVGKVGTATVSRDELTDLVENGADRLKNGRRSF